MKKLFLLILSILLCVYGTQIFSQKFTISGYVKDKQTGEDLPYCNVFIEEINKGTTTNNYGFYSITLNQGNYTLKISYIGYEVETKKINLNKDIKLNISLSPKVYTMQEIDVTGEKINKNVESTEMGTFRLPVETIKELPVLLGETDILKTIQLLPGIQSGGEGNSGFYVRGGGPDQNLILLDNAIVYNPGHLFGFFSVFNSDAVKDITLIKGGMPANYGGRLSSVLDVIMKEGNMNEIKGTGGIGLIASRLTLEGPIKKDTASFLISGRRTYADLVLKPFQKKDRRGSGYYFYDLNAKINYKISDKDRLFLSGYFGQDIFSFKSKSDSFMMKFPWGNATMSLRWNHVFNQKIFQNLTFTYSNYKYKFEAEQNRFAFILFSGVSDYALSLDYTYLPNILHNVKFGVKYMFHNFTPSSVSARIGETNFNWDAITHYYANDLALYINDEYDLNEKIKISLGIRPTMFQHIGPFKRYILDYQNRVIDSILYKKFENIALYKNIEPRASIRYSINNSASIKTSYTQNYQYIQLASMSSNTLPTDIWIPATDIIKPQFSEQYAIGVFKNFSQNRFESSIELYYKNMNNLIDYKEGLTSDNNINNNPDNNFTFGKGKSYGVEFFLKKRTGNFTGWLGYTLSKTTRKFPEINNGKEYPAKYDRRHDLSVVLSYDINERMNLSAVFVYATGDATTMPVNVFFIDSRIMYEYGERNSYRLPPYHRADVSFTYKFPDKGKRWHSSLNVSVYNLYNRKNPYFIYIDTDTDLANNSITMTGKQVSLFPILPAVTYNFNF